MAGNRRVRETPYQDICRIRRNILAIRESKGSLSPDDMFMDPSFTSDMTSLAYVYSGDDKYEKAIFKRPHKYLLRLVDQRGFSHSYSFYGQEFDVRIVNNSTNLGQTMTSSHGNIKNTQEFSTDPVLAGVGGVCDEPFPWRHWKQRHWLQASLVVVSLSIGHLEKIIPGYKHFEQDFVNDYTGAFHFYIWRFGEWVDIVVDDRLPLLDDRHLFCGPMGSAQELWGPLVEKAYAKCKKTYQSIEYGNTLDALTDLTGAVCEHFTPDVRPPRNLFRILVKSHMARSQMVCWRNEKRLTPTGFYADIEQQETLNRRYLHVITAVTRFPTSDGRCLEMVRLKCPFSGEPRWQGRFSDRDFGSWESVNRDFMHRFQPVTKKDEDEYWLSVEDFRCNFGGLFIISSAEPFRVDGLSLARSYHLQDGWDYHANFLSGDFVASPSSSSSSSSNDRYFRRSSTPKPEQAEEGLLDSDSLKLARRRTSHASLHTSSHPTHFHPPRHPHNHHLHHHHHHYQRAMKKEQRQMMPNEEEHHTTDTQSLFTKRNFTDKGAKSDTDPTSADEGHVITSDGGVKKGFFFRSALHHHHPPKPSRRSSNNSNDLQRLAMSQSEAKRSEMSLQSDLTHAKLLLLDCPNEHDSDAYESSTDEYTVGQPSKDFTASTQPADTRSLEQAALGSCQPGTAKPVPCRRTVSADDMSSRLPTSPKPVASPKPALKLQTTSSTPSALKPAPKSPKPTPKSPKPLPKSPKPTPKSPKSSLKSPKPQPRSPKPPVKAPKPPVKPSSKDRGASTPSPTLVKKMTPPTNVATVMIGNLSPTLSAPKEPPTKSPKPAARNRGLPTLSTPNKTETSNLMLPSFKPPKSPTPHGKRYFRAVSPTPQRPTSPLLPSPDSLRSPDIFSITITREKSSENLSVPVFGEDSQFVEKSEFRITSPEQITMPTSKREVGSNESEHKTIPQGNALLISTAALKPLEVGLAVTGTTDTKISTDQQVNAGQETILLLNESLAPKSTSFHPERDPKMESAFHSPEGERGEQIGNVPERFFQPLSQHPCSRNSSSSSNNSGPNTPVDSKAVLLPCQPPHPQPTERGHSNHSTVQTAVPSSTAQGTQRSFSTTSDTGSTQSSSDIFLHFKPASAPALLEGGEKRFPYSCSSNAGRRGTQGSITEEMGEEGEVGGEKDKGFLLPSSATDSRRPHSAPQSSIARHFSSSSLSSLTQGHFRATKADYFRSEGRWRYLLEVFDKWTSTKQSACRANLELHSRAQRHHFHIGRQDYVDEVSPPTLQAKRHVLVSLLQDYRHGAITANSLLVPIGFCVYKCKSVERDDKRHIAKFQLVDQVHGEPEMREVTARLDLDPGYYFIVPFYRTEGHTGEYLLRVLTEDCPQTKAGCRVS